MTEHSPDPQRNEASPADDAVIWRAFRWSLLVAVLIAGLVFGMVWWRNRKPPAVPPQETALTAPAKAAETIAEIPAATFTDLAASAGITFVHYNGAYGEKLLPETMGGGVAFFDFDNDGDPDLLFINGTQWPFDRQRIDWGPTWPGLYRNDGGGRFTDVTRGSGLDIECYGMGVACGDYDNDGLPDVFITAGGGNHLFPNLGHGKFQEGTGPPGVRGPGGGGGSGQDWSTGAAWIDYDNDGKLDLFVCNYVKWSREIDAEVGYKIDGKTRAYGQPMNFPGTFPYLYHNDGNGRFTDVSASSGVQVKNPETGLPMAKSLAVAP